MTKLEEAVREAWANAWNDGHSGWLKEARSVVIAMDMMDVDSDVGVLSRAYTDEEDIDSVENIVKQLKKEYGCD